jgi:predicted transcriptional regulator
MDQLSRVSETSSSRHVDLGYHDPLSDISQKLANIIEDISRLRSGSDVLNQDLDVMAIAKLRDAIMVRSLRNKLFPSGLFSDPAWDMVLDLMLASIEHRQISISSLCIASNAPTTTALRCIKALVLHGIIEIEADSEDRRRKIVKLTRNTLERMMKIISATF